MRDFMGANVSQVDEFGHQVDVDDIFATSHVRGSFNVRYQRNVDRLIVTVTSRSFDEMGMQLTLEQATLLLELLGAGIADMSTDIPSAEPVLELPAGGAQ
ncbi:hypothetical protein VMT65_31145 [Nocardia sp. CDC153]|uniref:hypothetical protein n=1 Tax=Nocardia sp. CDC153 TaxID=3112167 RepID=UPI002DBF7401|nr:hypothetical protein [Nocardia sp. CDC153]MEC3957526.1 hypothetical protein [Nocardia sp. CDC153]